MINIEAKCKECEAPVKLTGIIITPTHIDFSQIKPTECPACGCKWVSVRVTKEVFSVSPTLEQVLPQD
jgi:Zn finger protein HypA/HybF involved in hydrogenase expression